MSDLNPAGLEAAAKEVAHRERLSPTGERARSTAEAAVRAYLAASLPPGAENPWRNAPLEASEDGLQRTAWDRGFAAGRAAATPDPPTDERRPWPIAPDTVMPPRRQPVRWGSRADDPPTEIHDDPGKTKAYLAGLAAGRTEAAAASPDERLREAGLSDRNVARLFHEAYERRSFDWRPPVTTPDPFPTFCVTMDCGLRATRYVTCEGEGKHPYCDECADVLIRGGESDLGPVEQPSPDPFPNEPRNEEPMPDIFTPANDARWSEPLSRDPLLSNGLILKALDRSNPGWRNFAASDVWPMTAALEAVFSHLRRNQGLLLALLADGSHEVPRVEALPDA